MEEGKRKKCNTSLKKNKYYADKFLFDGNIITAISLWKWKKKHDIFFHFYCSNVY